VQTKVCGAKREEVRGEWRILHDKELYDRYSSQNVIQPIISTRMRGVGHVAQKEEKRNTYIDWWGSLKERDHLED
jgi:hypothetical protein